jgi:hypothetical protein
MDLHNLCFSIWYRNMLQGGKNKIYTGCRNINVFQVGGLVRKNLRNLEKIK